MLFAQENGRTIPKEDKIFAINGRAKAMIAEQGKENVVNATIGALLDDEGNLTVLSSVIDAIGTLAPVDFAEYAPIGYAPLRAEPARSGASSETTPRRGTRC